MTLNHPARGEALRAYATCFIEDDLLLHATLHLAVDLGNTEWTLACTSAVAVAR